MARRLLDDDLRIEPDGRIRLERHRVLEAAAAPGPLRSLGRIVTERPNREGPRTVELDAEAMRGRAAPVQLVRGLDRDGIRCHANSPAFDAHLHLVRAHLTPPSTGESVAAAMRT